MGFPGEWKEITLDFSAYVNKGSKVKAEEIVKIEPKKRGRKSPNVTKEKKHDVYIGDIKLIDDALSHNYKYSEHWQTYSNEKGFTFSLHFLKNVIYDRGWSFEQLGEYLVREEALKKKIDEKLKSS